VEVVVAYILALLYVIPLAHFETVTSSPLVARLQHTKVSAAILTATRKVMPTHGSAATSFKQGLAAMAEAEALLPLLPLPAHSQSSSVNARQSVGSDGDNDT